MEKKYYVSDIKELSNYDFSERLKFFINKWGSTQEEFYKELYNEFPNKQIISERTFKSYLTSKDKKSVRKPKKETIKVMAKILNIPSKFLVWDEKEFEEFFHKYLEEFQKKWKTPLLTIDIENEYDIACDIEPTCNWNTKEEAFEIFKRVLTDEYPKNEENREIYCFFGHAVNFFEKGNAKFVIDEKVYTVLNCFEYLNEKGRGKLLKYGNIIINDTLERAVETPMMPRNRGDMIKDDNFKWSKFKVSFLKNFPCFLFLGEKIVELKLESYQWDIFLMCIYMDANNNSIFPNDALESFTLIAQLFTLDDEFAV